MNRQYFCRRWIIQELAFAKRIRLYCGDEVADWAEFADSVSLLTTRAETVISMMSASDSRRLEFLNLFESMPLCPAVRLAGLIQDLFRKNEDEQITTSNFDLNDLIS